MIKPNGEEKLIASTIVFITNWIEYRFCDGALESTVYAMIIASQISKISTDFGWMDQSFEGSNKYPKHDINQNWSQQNVPFKVVNLFQNATSVLTCCSKVNLDYNHTKYVPGMLQIISDSKVLGANLGPIWGRQDPGGPHVGPMNFAIWDYLL